MTAPATQLVTYADQATGVAYANPSSTTANVTFYGERSNGRDPRCEDHFVARRSSRLAESGSATRHQQLPGFGYDYRIRADHQPGAERRSLARHLITASRSARRQFSRLGGHLLLRPYRGGCVANDVHVCECRIPAGYLHYGLHFGFRQSAAANVRRCGCHLHHGRDPTRWCRTRQTDAQPDPASLPACWVICSGVPKPRPQARVRQELA